MNYKAWGVLQKTSEPLTLINIYQETRLGMVLLVLRATNIDVTVEDVFVINLVR